MPDFESVAENLWDVVENMALEDNASPAEIVKRIAEELYEMYSAGVEAGL